MPETVVLNAAYVFDCPSCGHTNFGRMVEAELTKEEENYLLERIDTDHGEEWKNEDAPFTVGCGLVQMPDEVKCGKCGEAFEAWKEEGDGELDDLPERFRPKQ